MRSNIWYCNNCKAGNKKVNSTSRLSIQTPHTTGLTAACVTCQINPSVKKPSCEPFKGREPWNDIRLTMQTWYLGLRGYCTLKQPKFKISINIYIHKDNFAMKWFTVWQMFTVCYLILVFTLGYCKCESTKFAMFFMVAVNIYKCSQAKIIFKITIHPHKIEFKDAWVSAYHLKHTYTEYFTTFLSSCCIQLYCDS